jgi:hypothetical protein
MANVTTLYDIQPVIESAAMAILSSSAGITNVYLSRNDNSDRPTPRVEVQCVLGTPNGHVYLSSSREWWHDQFECQVNALVTTDRAFSEVSHSTYVSKVRSTLYNNKLYNTASLLPNHVLLRPQMNGAQYTIDEERNMDMTAIGTNFIVAIKPASWD